MIFSAWRNKESTTFEFKDKDSECKYRITLTKDSIHDIDLDNIRDYLKDQAEKRKNVTNG